MERGRPLLLDPARGEEKLMEIQQHDGVVVMEERGNPAGLRQAPQERRRERGRAAPKERCSHVSWEAQTSTIYNIGVKPTVFQLLYDSYPR